MVLMGFRLEAQTRSPELRFHVGTGACDMGRPVRHEFASPFEQIAAPVRSLDAVAVDVRQREFADLARRVGALHRLVRGQSPLPGQSPFPAC